MRIALDATYGVGENLTGVGVYSREIVTRLPAARPEHRFLLCYRPHRLARGLREPAAANCRRTLLSSWWPRRTALFHGLNQRVDSFHGRRTVATFHDLFVFTADYSSPEFRARFQAQAREAAARSDLIIAVSQFTASQVESLLKIPRERIRVVYHGVSPKTPGVEAGPRSKVILFVGALQKRKNVLRLVQAFERTAPGWRLVLAGSPGYGFEEIAARADLSPRRADISLPGFVPAEELDRLYRTASIFAFPSLDEGFGIPVLEAMAYGAPVLTSNRSALAEIAGEAALRVAPEDVDGIAEGLERLTKDEQLRAKLALAGLRRSAEFSWERAVQQTWSVYDELIR